MNKCDIIVILQSVNAPPSSQVQDEPSPTLAAHAMVHGIEICGVKLCMEGDVYRILKLSLKLGLFKFQCQISVKISFDMMFYQRPYIYICIY